MPALKKTTLPTGFTSLADERKALGEISATGRSRDCTVVAMTIVTGLSYATCHEALAAAGRRKGCGTYQDVQRRAYETLGFKWREWSVTERVAMCHSYYELHKKSASTITTHHPRRFPKAWAPHRDKALLLYSRGHVSAMIGGVVQDWAINRSKQVYKVVEITRKAD